MCFIACFLAAVLTPFSLLFRSDEFETVAEAALGQAGNMGFNLVYVMDAIACNVASI